jgi:transposase-like protein
MNLVEHFGQDFGAIPHDVLADFVRQYRRKCRKCPGCGSESYKRHGYTIKLQQRFQCRVCAKTFILESK